MSKSVVINGVTYQDVPAVAIPLAADPSEEAMFYDPPAAAEAAGASDIRAGKKAIGANGEITGTLPEKSGSDVTASGDTVSIPAGIYDSPVSKQIAAGSVTPDATLAGSVLGDTVSDYPVTATPGASVTPGYISSAQSGSVATKYVQVEDVNVTPSGTQQEILPTMGKLIKRIIVAAVSLLGNATPADVLSGKTFYSNSLTLQTGTATVPTVSQDSTTKILTVM